MNASPAIIVPLPLAVVGTLDPSTPLARHTRADLTPFLDEWATLLLDPVEAVEYQVTDLLELLAWEAAGWAQVSGTATRLLRDLGKSRVVVEALALRESPLVRRSASGEASLDPARSVPQLAGLAITTALFARVGRESRRVWQAQRRADADARAAAERRSASGASEAAAKREA